MAVSNRTHNDFKPIMNTPRLILSFLTVFGLLFATTSFKQNVLLADQSEEEDPLLVAIGFVVDEDEKSVRDCEVSLFRHNDSVQQAVTKKNGKFEFILNRNDYYTVEIRKEGFYTKRVAISTDVPGDEEDMHEFDFAIELIALGEFDGVDNFVLDFPSAKIVYHEGRKQFAYDRDYSKNIKTEINQLYEEVRAMKSSAKSRPKPNF